MFKTAVVRLCVCFVALTLWAGCGGDDDDGAVDIDSSLPGTDSSRVESDVASSTDVRESAVVDRGNDGGAADAFDAAPVDAAPVVTGNDAADGGPFDSAPPDSADGSRAGDATDGALVDSPVEAARDATDASSLEAAIVDARSSDGDSAAADAPISDGNDGAPALIAPAVTGLSPTQGPSAGGDVLTITGTAFTGTTAVVFGSLPATAFTVVSDTQITATAPASTVGDFHVRVTTPGGTSSAGAADLYTYAAAPTVTGVSPSLGSVVGGDTVTISGTDFATASAVTFGATSAVFFIVTSQMSITATAPAGTAGAVDIRVTAVGGTSAAVAADQYIYVSVPTVTLAIPQAGPLAGGTSVQVRGTNLTGAIAVFFGASPATSFTVQSDTRIMAVSPAGSAGAVDVTVTTFGGTSATSSSDQFTYVAAPVVTSVSPSTGPNRGGSTVTITGTGLSGGGFFSGFSVHFGSAIASPVTINSDTELTMTPPTVTAAATVDVTVTTAGGTSATSAADQYTFDGTQVIGSANTNVTFTGSINNDTFLFRSDAGTGNTINGGGGAASNIVFEGKSMTDIVIETTSAGATTITFSGGQTVTFSSVLTLHFADGTQVPPYPTIP